MRKLINWYFDVKLGSLIFMIFLQNFEMMVCHDNIFNFITFVDKKILILDSLHQHPKIFRFSS